LSINFPLNHPVDWSTPQALRVEDLEKGALVSLVTLEMVAGTRLNGNIYGFL
jgi:hypothetical protein